MGKECELADDEEDEIVIIIIGRGRFHVYKGWPVSCDVISLSCLVMCSLFVKFSCF